MYKQIKIDSVATEYKNETNRIQFEFQLKYAFHWHGKPVLQ